MDIMMSLHREWANKIFIQQKTLEFRNKIGKYFTKGSKVYIYETSKNNGSKKIVGEFIIKDIKKIPKSDMGCYPFLGYYYEKIQPDKEALDAINKIYSIKMDHYKDGIKLNYIFLPWVLEELNETNNLPDLLNMSPEEFQNFLKLQNKSEQIVDACDNWLTEIGYYNDYGESYFKYYIEIEQPIKYEKPLELSDFVDIKNDTIKKAPQSFMYCKKVLDK